MLEINLLPDEQRPSRTDFSWLVDKRIYLPTLILLATLFGSFLYYLVLRDRLVSLQDEVVRVDSEIQREKPLLGKIKELDDKLAVIAEKNKALKSIQVSRKRWIILFENLSSVLPPNMWISSINQTSDNAMELKGTTFDFAEVAEYMVSLERQVSFTSIVLVSITNQQVGTEASYAFTLKCSINPNLGMEEK